MKKAGKKYQFRSSQALKRDACSRAADRVESYEYRKRYDDPVLSIEALSNLNSKLKKFDDSSTRIWENRNSLIATPFGSEMCLSNERGSNSVMLGSSRNYFSDLMDPFTEPNARARFPYNDEAHISANRIKSLFKRVMRRRHQAARIVQRNIKAYIVKTAVKEQIRRTNELVSKVQRKFRRTKKRLKDTRLKREEQAALKAEAEKVKSEALFFKQLAENKEKKFQRGVLLMTREARDFIHRRRRARGKRKREFLAARKIQAWYRGCQVRQHIKRVKSAQILIVFRWRKYFRHRYGPQAATLQRLYRRQKMKLAVRYLQKVMKGALGRRKFLRKRLEVLAVERARNSRECVAVTRTLRGMSQNRSWMEDDQQVPPFAIVDHMRRLDIYCLGVLKANALQLDKDYVNLHPAKYSYTEDEATINANRLVSEPSHSIRQRIVFAILNIFVNRPGECLDHTSLGVCRAYLKPCTRLISSDAWENLMKFPMLNVESLSKVVEPTSAVLKKVRISGRGKYLPAEVLAKAVMVYRWTTHFEWAAKQAVNNFRLQHKPRRVCNKCQFPLTFDGEVYDHRVCFNNGSCMAWMSKDLDSCRDVLYEYCNSKRFKAPSMKRDYYGDKVKLSNSDLDAAKRKYESFRSVKHVDEESPMESNPSEQKQIPLEGKDQSVKNDQNKKKDKKEKKRSNKVDKADKPKKKAK